LVAGSWNNGPDLYQHRGGGLAATGKNDLRMLK
jgi:hypothetical protein